jgi:hypothetical protein
MQCLSAYILEVCQRQCTQGGVERVPVSGIMGGGAAGFCDASLSSSARRLFTCMRLCAFLFFWALFLMFWLFSFYFIFMHISISRFMSLSTHTHTHTHAHTHTHTCTYIHTYTHTPLWQERLSGR